MARGGDGGNGYWALKMMKLMGFSYSSFLVRLLLVAGVLKKSFGRTLDFVGRIGLSFNRLFIKRDNRIGLLSFLDIMIWVVVVSGALRNSPEITLCNALNGNAQMGFLIGRMLVTLSCYLTVFLVKMFFDNL